MKEITENNVTFKGLDWVKTFDEFQITGNHYYPFPDVLDMLEYEYTHNTEYFGAEDQGWTRTTFKRKTSEEVLNKALQEQIEAIQDAYGIIIESYRIVDRDTTAKRLRLI